MMQEGMNIYELALFAVVAAATFFILKTKK
jgi:hypothetical protein